MAVHKKTAPAWLLAGLGLGLFIVPLRQGLAPRGSMRRVIMALGLFGYLIGVILYFFSFGDPTFLASIVTRLLLIGAYAQTAVAALRVEAERRQTLLRAALGLLLLPLALICLFVL